MFDWGATAITAILEKEAVFGLQEALDKIQKRPWLFDGLEKWLDKLQVNSYKPLSLCIYNICADLDEILTLHIVVSENSAPLCCHICR